MEQFGVNIEDIKKLTSVLASNPPTSMQNVIKKEPKQVKIVEPVKARKNIEPIKSSQMEQQMVEVDGSVNSANSPNQSELIQNETNQMDSNTSLFGGNSQFVTLGGYSLPRYTLYLIVVLVLLGIAIWYLNSDKRKNKRKLVEKDDEENEK